MATTLLTFVSNIYDIRHIAFNSNLTVETRNTFLDILLTHNKCSIGNVEEVLLDKIAYDNTRKRALSIFLEYKDENYLYNKTLKIIKNLKNRQPYDSRDVDIYIIENCREYIKKLYPQSTMSF